jgi:hypothetical protein
LLLEKICLCPPLEENVNPLRMPEEEHSVNSKRSDKLSVPASDRCHVRSRPRE